MDEKAQPETATAHAGPSLTREEVDRLDSLAEEPGGPDDGGPDS